MNELLRFMFFGCAVVAAATFCIVCVLIVHYVFCKVVEGDGK